jgi:outer membrane lipoprotein-sorting protein
MAAVIIGVVNPSFLEALAVAACSAIITGVFLVVSTHMQQRKTVEKVQEVIEKVDTVQATVDQEASSHGG